jgi:hypothetical protein
VARERIEEEMRRVSLLLAIIGIACSTVASAQDADNIDWANLKTETVLKAINAFEAAPAGEGSDAEAAIIVRFAEASSNVQVTVNVSLLPWIKNAKEITNSEKLLAAFVAGSIRPQLRKGINKDQPVDGVIYMCKVYTALRKAKAIENIPELGKWSKLDRTGVQILIYNLAPADPVPKKTKAYKEKQTGITFPRIMGVCEIEGPHEYDQPELGVSVTYWSMGSTKIDIYVYNGGHTNLTSGAKSDTVKKQLKIAEDNIFEMEKRGYYGDVKKMPNSSGAFKGKTGELDFISTTFQYTQKGRGRAAKTSPMQSHLVLTTYKGYFLKVRFTRVIDPKHDDDEIDDFLKQLGKLLEIE